MNQWREVELCLHENMLCPQTKEMRWQMRTEPNTLAFIPQHIKNIPPVLNIVCICQKPAVSE